MTMRKDSPKVKKARKPPSLLVMHSDLKEIRDLLGTIAVLSVSAIGTSAIVGAAAIVLYFTGACHGG